MDVEAQAAASSHSQTSKSSDGKLEVSRGMTKADSLFGPRFGSSLSLNSVRRAELVWADLTYTVVIGRGKKAATKTVLDGVSGVAAPGQLLAVMGPTGSGKTSLLNALAGRLPKSNQGRLEGQLLVNGHPRGAGFRSIAAFVQQDDVLFPNLTVRETLTFAAGIRLPGSMDREAKGEVVERVITHLGLAKSADTFVGNAETRGVSGGERKRVNIAQELLGGPSILFLDEPTSGLDAFQAQNVMEAMLMLAGEGRTVITTIHQPRSSIVQLFDQLLLLSEGRLMYKGPAADAPAYFETAGHSCPSFTNPADFMLDLVSVDHRTPEGEAATRARVAALGDRCAAQGGPRAGADVEAPAAAAAQRAVSVRRLEAEAGGVEEPRFANNPLTEFRLLVGRATRQTTRNHAENIALVCQTCIIAAVFAILYSGMSPSKPGGVQDEISLLFLCAITIAMNSTMGTLMIFSQERQVTDRERASRAYRVAPYYISRLVVAIPLRVIQGLLFGSILYWSAGLNPSATAFVIFCFLIVCEDLAGQGLGLAVSAAVPHEKVAMALTPMIVILLMLFSGFYVNSATLPVWLAWIKYVSHLYYGLQGLALNDFTGRTGWACPVGSPQPCSVSGDDILKQLGFYGDSLGFAFMGLLLLTLGFNVLGYLALRFKKPRYLPLSVAPAKKAV